MNTQQNTPSSAPLTSAAISLNSPDCRPKAIFNQGQHYLETLLDHIAQGVLFIDAQGFIQTYNKAAEKFFEIPSEQILFHDFWLFFNDNLFGFSMREALDHKKLLPTYSINYTSPRHHSYEFEISPTVITEAEENPFSGLMITIRDITEMHYLQILANRSDRMKELGEITSHVAHEIRNPLGGIKGFASLLKRDLKDNPTLEKMADYIIEGTDNLSRLVNQILHYARPVQLHVEKVDIIPLLFELHQHVLADETIEHQKIEFSIHAEIKELILWLDPLLFKSALLNLFVNSIQAMPEGGKLSLTVQKKPNHVMLIITDTGIGIPEENLKKLYSPFFTTKIDGNGLGLPEVQKIILAHGGSIEVKSKVEKGTSFFIKLPLKQR